MNDPRTMDEYLDLVHQAVYEVDELRACVDDDMEEMEAYMPFVEQLDAQLRALFNTMTDGSYTFPGDTDLPFMAVVRRYGAQIPFKTLLETINRIHRRGLA